MDRSKVRQADHLAGLFFRLSKKQIEISRKSISHHKQDHRANLWSVGTVVSSRQLFPHPQTPPPAAERQDDETSTYVRKESKEIFQQSKEAKPQKLTAGPHAWGYAAVMACTSPLTAWHAGKTENGKRKLVFKGRERQDGPEDNGSILLPCGQCIGCRLDRTRDWAVRIMNETHQWEDNSFITLTYHDSALPKHYGLEKTDWRNFMNLLRKHFVPKDPKEYEKIRFFQSGEYGPTTLRPHYHACLFNWRPDDLVFFKEEKTTGITLFTSETLDWLWQYKGFTTIGNVDFDSAAYCAGYITGKATGPRAAEEYRRTDDGKTEWTVIPPYANMSRRPGIGHNWYKEFKGDLRKDFVTYKGKKMKPPKYYDKLLEKGDKEQYEIIKKKRTEMAIQHEKTSYQLHSRSLINKATNKHRSEEL